MASRKEKQPSKKAVRKPPESKEKTKRQPAPVVASAGDSYSEAIRQRLSQIAESNSGYVSPDSVVADAKDERSILHGEFEWDDSVAGHQYRLAQARGLIRRVMVTVVRTSGPARQLDVEVTRAYHSIPEDRHAGGGYQKTEEIMGDKGKRRSLIAHVLRMLLGVQKRFNTLRELRGVWDAIEEAAIDNDVADDAPQSKATEPVMRA